MAFPAEKPVLAHSEFRPIGEIERADARFDVVSEFEPAGDQPAAIDELERRVNDGERDIVLLGATGTGNSRKYLHDAGEAEPFGQEPGTFTPWNELPRGSDLLFYEGLHGAYADDKIDIARQVDLLVDVVPIINLEWIQKLHRDQKMRGYSQEAVTDTILRRMPDYVNYICPQFEHTHVNFQRVPMVDTSNPFIARDIPSADESMVVIRFTNPKGIDFQYLRSMIDASFMSRANTIVVPGGKMELAMQLIFTPFVWRMMERRKRAMVSL